ncbi:hypothetical protein KJ866_04560 [Patescibacteria group bacterium]|nr:hypothetical protein [Patescibacteria group bacterium]MBU2219748.1 hypothetical protein [Patescibacteria group bacterium]MBU2265320.1 hypothetical protein [Patescibacteria group bacterium]
MKLLKIFDLLEDKIRHWLSHWPILYAFVGILGIVLTWRGIWHIADSLGLNSWWSLFIGVAILMVSGLLIAIAIGDEVLINAWRGRRKITEISLGETLTLAERVEEIKSLLNKIEERLNAKKKEEEKIAKDLEKKID